MPNVISPYYKVLFNNIDITEDISNDVLEIVYDEGDDGEADDLRILLDDMLGKWKDRWIVAVGQTVEVEIGYNNGRRLNCGKFQIDEVNYRGQPDSVELKCLSIGEDNKWREPDSKIFVDQTVEQIVKWFADKNGVEVKRMEKYAADQQTLAWEERVFSMTLSRVVQDRESDIGFLNRILNKFGIKFKLGPTMLHVFVAISYDSFAPVSNAKVYIGEELADRPGQILYEGEFIDLNKNIQLFSYDIKNCSKYTISKTELRYHDPFTDELYQYEVDYDSLPPGGKINPMQQDLNTFLRKEKEYIDVDNEQQAEIAAKAALYDKISKQLEGEFELDGAPEVVRGVAIPVLGLKKLSGNYYVTSSYHRLNRMNGYTTSCKVKWISELGVRAS